MSGFDATIWCHHVLNFTTDSSCSNDIRMRLKFSCHSMTEKEDILITSLKRFDHNNCFFQCWCWLMISGWNEHECSQEWEKSFKVKIWKELRSNFFYYRRNYTKPGGGFCPPYALTYSSWIPDRRHLPGHSWRFYEICDCLFNTCFQNFGAK